MHRGKNKMKYKIRILCGDLVAWKLNKILCSLVLLTHITYSEEGKRREAVEFSVPGDLTSRLGLAMECHFVPITVTQKGSVTCA